MDRLFLHCLNSQAVQFLVEHLTEIHNHRFMDLLPQMGTENLNQRDLQSWNFSMQENTRQIQLDLESDVDLWNLVSTRNEHFEGTGYVTFARFIVAVMSELV